MVCDKDWEGKSGDGVQVVLEAALVPGVRGLGRQCFQIQLKTGQKSFPGGRDDLMIPAFQQHYLVKELLTQHYPSESSISVTLLVQGSVSGAWYLKVKM